MSYPGRIVVWAKRSHCFVRLLFVHIGVHAEFESDLCCFKQLANTADIRISTLAFRTTRATCKRLGLAALAPVLEQAPLLPSRQA